MAEGLNGIITQLERQKTAIERALAALRHVGATVAPPLSPAEAPARKHKKFSAASRRRMALAQKARWAKIKGEAAPLSTPAPTPATKRRISPDGMKRIIAATKKRWRLQRAATKSAPAKNAGKKAPGWR